MECARAVRLAASRSGLLLGSRLVGDARSFAQLGGGQFGRSRNDIFRKFWEPYLWLAGSGERAGYSRCGGVGDSGYTGGGGCAGGGNISGMADVPLVAGVLGRRVCRRQTGRYAGG